MKVFLVLSLIFIFVSNFKSQIIVKTAETGLNLRTEPTMSSTVLHSIPNETTLLYANEWSEGWIKVRYISYGYINGSDENIDAIGWVNASYIDPKFFKSKILDSLSWEKEVDGAFSGVYGVFGLIGIEEYDEKTQKSILKINLNGKKIQLKPLDDNSELQVWQGEGLRLEFFGAITDSDVGFSESQGILRVDFNGKVEYIYAAFGGGC